LRITGRLQTLVQGLFVDCFLFFAFFFRGLFLQLPLLVFAIAFDLSLPLFFSGTKLLNRFQTLTKFSGVQTILEFPLIFLLHHLQQMPIVRQASSPTLILLFLFILYFYSVLGSSTTFAEVVILKFSLVLAC
jgi:hypothetical protein